MTIERQLQLFNEMLDWASAMYDNFELYEWCRNRGMTEQEIVDTFCVDEKDLEEYRQKYDEHYDN